MRGIHRFRAPTQFESVDPTVDGTPNLRRLLGLFLLLHLQCQRHGQSKSHNNEIRPR